MNANNDFLNINPSQFSPFALHPSARPHAVVATPRKKSRIKASGAAWLANFQNPFASISLRRNRRSRFAVFAEVMQAFGALGKAATTKTRLWPFARQKKTQADENRAKPLTMGAVASFFTQQARTFGQRQGKNFQLIGVVACLAVLVTTTTLVPFAKSNPTGRNHVTSCTQLQGKMRATEDRQPASRVPVRSSFPIDEMVARGLCTEPDDSSVSEPTTAQPEEGLYAQQVRAPDRVASRISLPQGQYKTAVDPSEVGEVDDENIYGLDSEVAQKSSINIGMTQIIHNGKVLAYVAPPSSSAPPESAQPESAPLISAPSAPSLFLITPANAAELRAELEAKGLLTTTAKSGPSVGKVANPSLAKKGEQKQKAKTTITIHELAISYDADILAENTISWRDKTVSQKPNTKSTMTIQELATAYADVLTKRQISRLDKQERARLASQTVMSSLTRDDTVPVTEAEARETVEALSGVIYKLGHSHRSKPGMEAALKLSEIMSRTARLGGVFSMSKVREANTVVGGILLYKAKKLTKNKQSDADQEEADKYYFNAAYHLSLGDPDDKRGNRDRDYIAKRHPDALKAANEEIHRQNVANGFHSRPQAAPSLTAL